MAVNQGRTELLYLAGMNISRGPSEFKMVGDEAAQSERLLDTARVTDRAFGWEHPPDVILKYTFGIGWPRVGDADYRHFARLAAYPLAFDLCPWKFEVEYFSGDGATTTFTLSRRVALEEIDEAFLPPEIGGVGPEVRYASECLVDGSPATFTVGTADAEGHQPFTITSGTPAAGVANIEFFYVPLYLVGRPNGNRDERDMSDPFTERRGLVLEEVS